MPEKKPIFVRATKPVGDAPALYMKLEDTEKVGNSKTINKWLKLNTSWLFSESIWKRSLSVVGHLIIGYMMIAIPIMILVVIAG